MSVWFLLWFFLSAALLYILGWTLLILFRQKKAWQAYAAKNKLRFVPGKLLESPSVSGVVSDYTVSLFSGEHEIADGRSTRKMTAIEINLTSRVPFEGALASGGMVKLIRALGFKEEISPVHANWDKGWIAATSNRNALEAYIAAPRLEALVSLMKIPKAWVVFIFRDDTVLLRLDTSDPLLAVEKIEKYVQKMIETARVLELKTGEDKNLKAAMEQISRHQTTKVLKAGESEINLELEE